jgi:taurine dioxygenase
VAELVGVDRAGSSAARRVVSALRDHGVVVVREQELTAAELVELSRQLGPVEALQEWPAYPGLPEILPVANDPARGFSFPTTWHTDGWIRARPPRLTLFYAVELPAEGGDTLFIDACRAYEELPADERLELAQLRAGPSDELIRTLGRGIAAPVRHPVVRTHPERGVRGLYLNIQDEVVIEGRARSETRELLARLSRHLARPGRVYRHRYEPGDLVVWDNAAVLHAAGRPAPPQQSRLMLRTTVRPERPF